MNIQLFIAKKQKEIGKNIQLSIDSCIPLKYKACPTVEKFTSWYKLKHASRFNVTPQEMPTLIELIKLRWQANELTQENIPKTEKERSETKSEAPRGIHRPAEKHDRCAAMIEYYIKRGIFRNPDYRYDSKPPNNGVIIKQ